MADSTTNAPESTKTPAREKKPAAFEQLGDVAAAPQHDRSMMNAQQVLQLQRTIGNQAVRQLMAKRATPVAPVSRQADAEDNAVSDFEEGEKAIVTADDSPTPEDHAPTQRIQRVTATVKGKSVGKTSLRNGAGKIVGKAKRGIELDVDNSRTVALPGVAKQYYLVTDASQAFPGASAPLMQLYVEAGAVTVEGGDEVEDEGGEAEAEDAVESTDELATLEIELFEGHKIAINRDGGTLSGEIEEEFAMPGLDAISFDIQFPIPAAPGLLVEAGITITPTMALTLSGTYNITKAASKTTFNFEGAAKAEASLGLEARAGIGVGVANVFAATAGLFAEAKIGATLEGKLEGEVERDARKTWTKSNLKLSLAGEAAITAKVGAYVKASLGPLSASKKYTLKEKDLATWKFERAAEINKADAKLSGFKPKLSDIDTGDGQVELNPGEVVPDTAPLLGGGGRSDSAS